MKAAVLRTVPGELELIDDLVLDAPRSREVLVETRAVGICHSDLHFLDGTLGYPTPTVLGHEVAGVVVAVGDEVRDFVPGDHVVGCLTPFCGSCDYCLSGRMHLCREPSLQRAEGDFRLSTPEGPVHQFVNLSAFAEQMLVHEHALVKVPADTPMAVAAVVGCAVLTGVGAVIHTASVKPGETVAVVGCGGVGLSVIQGAVLAGAARIIAIDRSAEALRYAAELGASDVIDASAVDPLEALQELLGDGVDHAFEAIGNKVTVELSWRLVRRGGTVTVLGLLPADLKIELDASGFGDEKKIQGCSMGSQRFRSDVPYYLEMYRQGRLKLDELILRTYDFHDIGTALSDLKRGAPGRGVVMFPAADAATTAPAKG